MNTKRSLQQSTAASELRKLEEEWYALAAKCVAVDSAAKDLEAQAEAIVATAKE